MSILNETLPTSFRGQEIRTDFRVWMEVEGVLADGSMDVSERLTAAVLLVFPVPPKDVQAALQFLVWFYRCGKDVETKGGNGKTINNIYSYEHDAEYIYGAFLEQYGIDLSDVDFLHWWKFRSMFRSLKADCEFVKIMGYRAVDITSEMSKGQQEFYREMKRIHALPLPADEQAEIDALNAALSGDGDLRGLV